VIVRMAKGRIKYVPEDVLREVKAIMGADRIHGEAEGFRRMADYSRRARRVDFDVDFGPLGVRRKRGGK